jgi:methylated-DNA-[protein]-cysteine S-methyltransferase
MKLYYDIFSTALGGFAVAVEEQGAVVGAGFGGKEALPKGLGELIHDPKAAGAAREQIQEYLNGKRQNFTLTLAPRGTAFQQSVWSALRKIPFGATRSYKEIAAETGNAEGARAVGGAVGSNPICLVIPCHRVIASDGSLGGFAFGLPAKRRLLELEGALGVGARP